MEIAGSRALIHALPMPRRSETMPTNAMAADQTGRRLWALREALGLKKSEMADQLGIERTYWSRFEGGRRQISLDVAATICQNFPVTMDWLILGRTDTLPPDMAQKIRPLLNK